jgi:ferrous iron transport protein A
MVTNEEMIATSSKGMKSLNQLDEGQSGVIVSIFGGGGASKRLADLGLVRGKRIKIIRKTLFRGPVQIEVGGSRLIIGRGLTAKIMVELK